MWGSGEEDYWNSIFPPEQCGWKSLVVLETPGVCVMVIAGATQMDGP
jgi:hypothetical protein